MCNALPGPAQQVFDFYPFVWPVKGRAAALCGTGCKSDGDCVAAGGLCDTCLGIDDPYTQPACDYVPSGGDEEYERAGRDGSRSDPVYGYSVAIARSRDPDLFE